jgi:thioredoxin-related protein
VKTLIAAAFLFLFATLAGSAVELGEDGLHKEDWFAVTFRDVADDIREAKESGRRLAMIFEQRGCIYCKEIHEQVLTDPKVRDYLKKNFMIVQYNLYGDEEVTDIDGESLTEKTVARKWGVMFTPTILFMPVDVPEGKNARQAAVAIMPGAFHTGTFLDLFTWVNDQGYNTEEGFQAYHARRIRERTAAGEENTD